MVSELVFGCVACLRGRGVELRVLEEERLEEERLEERGGVIEQRGKIRQFCGQ
jgi:hypothetical protein